MNEREVEEMLETLRRAHCRVSFAEFCRRTGFEGEYAGEKFLEFGKGVRALTNFDTETLAKILAG